MKIKKLTQPNPGNVIQLLHENYYTIGPSLVMIKRLFVAGPASSDLVYAAGEVFYSHHVQVMDRIWFSSGDMFHFNENGSLSVHMRSTKVD